MLREAVKTAASQLAEARASVRDAGGTGIQVLMDFQFKHSIREESYWDGTYSGNPLMRFLSNFDELIDGLIEGFRDADSCMQEFWDNQGAHAPPADVGRLEKFNAIAPQLRTGGRCMHRITQLSGAARDLTDSELSELDEICPLWGRIMTDIERKEGLELESDTDGSGTDDEDADEEEGDASDDESQVPSAGHSTGTGAGPQAEVPVYVPSSMPLKRWIIAILFPWFARRHGSIGLFSESPVESFHAIVNRIMRNYGKLRGEPLARAYRLGVAAACHQGARNRAREIEERARRGTRKRKK